MRDTFIESAAEAGVLVDDDGWARSATPMIAPPCSRTRAVATTSSRSSCAATTPLRSLRWAQVQQRELSLGGSIGSSSCLTLHFGLGELVPVVAKVVWPKGAQPFIVDPPVDTIWTITKEP